MLYQVQNPNIQDDFVANNSIVPKAQASFDMYYLSTPYRRRNIPVALYSNIIPILTMPGIEHTYLNHYFWLGLRRRDE